MTRDPWTELARRDARARTTRPGPDWHEWGLFAALCAFGFVAFVLWVWGVW